MNFAGCASVVGSHTKPAVPTRKTVAMKTKRNGKINKMITRCLSNCWLIKFIEFQMGTLFEAVCTTQEIIVNGKRFAGR